MTDEDLDELLRVQVESAEPAPALVAALVAAARPRRPSWERYALGLAVAALVLVVAAPLGLRALDTTPEDSAGSPVVTPTDLPPPAGTRGVALPREVEAMAGFPAPGDRISVLAVRNPEGVPEASTLARDVPVLEVDPVRIAASPELAERLVAARVTSDLSVAVHVGDQLDVVIRWGGETPFASGDRADVLLLLTPVEGGVATHRTLVQDVEVIEADGGALRVRVSPQDAEKLALAHVMGDLAVTQGGRPTGGDPEPALRHVPTLLTGVRAVGPRVVHRSKVQATTDLQPAYPAGVQVDSNVVCLATVTIDEQGVPTEVSVASCPDAFVASTTATLLGARFEPPVIDGEPMGVLTTIPIKFPAR